MAVRVGPIYLRRGCIYYQKPYKYYELVGAGLVFIISINSTCFKMTDVALEFLFSVIHVLITWITIKYYIFVDFLKLCDNIITR